MAWLDDLASVTNAATSAIGNVAGVYSEVLTAKTGAALQKAELEARLATAKAQIAATGSASVPGNQSAAPSSGVNWMLIGGLLIGGLLIWKATQ